MVPTSSERWQLGFQVPGEHRYFYADDNGTRRLAIADASGATPDRTIDGILWVDTDAPIVVATDGLITLPLLRPDGSQVSAPLSVAEMLVVAHQTRMRIATQLGVFTSFRHY